MTKIRSSRKAFFKSDSSLFANLIFVSIAFFLGCLLTYFFTAKAVLKVPIDIDVAAFPETISVLQQLDDGNNPENKIHLANRTCEQGTHDCVRVPVNIRTRSRFNDKYTQIGYLTKIDSENNRILPLYCRRYTRNKFQYYTLSDTSFSIKLPLIISGRISTQQNGVDELISGEVVIVKNLGAFSVELYSNSSFDYIPLMSSN